MYHFDITMEDIRLVANSQDGKLYKCKTLDGHTGDEFEFIATATQLSSIITIATDPDGTPENVDDHYATCESLFEGAPQGCRFIP